MAYAVQFVGVQQAELQERVTDPAPPAAGEVLARTLFSAISAGTETAVYQGHLSNHFPCATGYAAVCEITHVGPEVMGLGVGDVVFAMAHHQSHQRLPAGSVAAVPREMSLVEAPLARLACVAMSTLVTTTARPPGKVLVTGLGMVGLLAAQVFDACGYEVHCVEPHPARREAAREHGATRVYEAMPLTDPALVGQVDLVLECSGHETAALEGCRMVRKRGEVVLVGVPWTRHSDLPAFDLLGAVFHQYAVLRSGWEWEVPRHPEDFQTGSIQANIAAALRWLAEGRLRVAGLYQVMSPRDCQDAYQGLMGRSLPQPAVVLDWSLV